MSDLFSGQKSLAPWIHPTVYEHLLQKINGAPKPSAAAADLPNKQQEQGGQRRPKPVQVLAIGACHLAVAAGEKYNAALHISDGATSIVATLSRNTDVAVRHLLKQLTRGCTVRIHDWEVVVESASTSRQAQQQQQDELFRQFAISKNNKAVYLRVNGGIVYLGSSKDVAGNATAILEDTDIRRALIALDDDKDKDHKQQQRQHAPVDLPVGSIAALFGVGAPSSDDIASSAAAAPLAVPEPAGGGLGTLDLPLGNISTLLEVSQPEVGDSAPAVGMSISPPPNDLPMGNLADLFGTNAEEDADVICEAATDKCLADISLKEKATFPQPEGPPKPHSDVEQRQMNSSASAVAVAKSAPPNTAGVQSESRQETVLETSSDDDDDEKEENLGIGNMLIDPTQGVEEAPETVDRSRDPSTTATFARESGRNQEAVDEAAGDGAYDDEWLETQQVGLPMDNDVEVLETQQSVPEKSNNDEKDADDDEGLETQQLDSSPRRKDSEILEAWKQHPESSSRGRKAQSMKPLVPTATRWFRTLDEEAKKSPSPKKRMKGSHFGGDRIRAFVEG